MSALLAPVKLAYGRASNCLRITGRTLRAPFESVKVIKAWDRGVKNDLTLSDVSISRTMKMRLALSDWQREGGIIGHTLRSFFVPSPALKMLFSLSQNRILFVGKVPCEGPFGGPRKDEFFTRWLPEHPTELDLKSMQGEYDYELSVAVGSMRNPW